MLAAMLRNKPNPEVLSKTEFNGRTDAAFQSILTLTFDVFSTWALATSFKGIGT